MLIQEIVATPDCVPGSAAIGRDLGDIAGIETVGVAATDDTDLLVSRCDVIIDFTNSTSTCQTGSRAARRETELRCTHSHVRRCAATHPMPIRKGTENTIEHGKQ